MRWTRTITVAALDTAEEMRELLESLANDDESDFRMALDLDISHIDQRAQGFDVRFVDVEIKGDHIHAHYEMDYNVYNGCKDMDIDDTYEGCATGVRVEDGWEFDEFVPPPKRDTVDEF
ncbi:MAG: hypothetical protein ORO03_03695 [Alphaproteobacteria bacterium]|nr:hypothetical protein [Alphaproteobacteria bacterium]